MPVFLTIDGVSTPLTYGSLNNAIQLQSLQFSEDTEASKQVISVSKRVTTSTPQIYALNVNSGQKSMAVYVFDDDTQESVAMQLGTSTVATWMISYENPESPREFFTIESAQVTIKSS